MKLNKIISIPKSLYVNFKLFEFKKAIKLPIIISYNTKIVGIKRGVIDIKGNITRGLITIGFDGFEGVQENKNSLLRIDNGGKIIFKGQAQFSAGISLRLGPNGILNIGENFAANKNCCILCDGNMKIGSDALLGCNVNIRDSDGHEIYDIKSNNKNPIQKNIIIGNHVWIASYVDILKGSKILDNSIVAYRSCVLSSFDKENCIIGGYPAKVLRDNVNWIK